MSPPSDDEHRPTDSTTDDEQPPAASAAEFDAPTDSKSVTSEPTEPPHHLDEETETTGEAETTTESLRRTLDGLLPEASVESNWWYWVAAVPVYFVVTLVGGVLAAITFLFAGVLDIAGLGGLASISTFILFGGVAALFGLVGIVVAVLFPVALYVDARAVEAADVEWRPDPVLWGLLAVVAVLVTNFVLSVPLALYYLYKRHESVGTP